MGDTAVAIEALRANLGRGPSPAQQDCLLAALLARTAPSAAMEWRERAEAERLFERALKKRYDPLCLLEYSGLKSRQAMRVDAGRLAARAFEIIARSPDLQTPEVMAEVYYRRALPLLGWIRQFDDLVYAPDLPVNTPGCHESGYFCEAYAKPRDFFDRLAERPPQDVLVSDERHVARGLLDSALALRPGHAGALPAALALAARAREWDRFRAYGLAAHAENPGAAGPLLTLLTAAVQRANREASAQWFDSLQVVLGPDALARFEGLALVADTSLRARLSGGERVAYGEAVWGLSDPLYLTAGNERRVAHYARVHLAELLYTDPESGRPGRETPQGRLVIRYGLPERVFVIKADQSLKLTESQRLVVGQILSCAGQPTSALGTLRGGDGEPLCVHAAAPGQAMHGGGRWEFWYYAEGGVPFVFERALGAWAARHMFATESLDLDRALHRAVPSTYQPPFRGATVRSLVTRFPRPRNPGVEVWAAFSWDSLPVQPSRYARVGAFLHSRTTGKLISHAVLDARTGLGNPVRFSRVLPATPGPLQLAVEGTLLQPEDVAAQERHAFDVRPPAQRDSLWLSDLLIGDSAHAPAAIAERDDVRMFGRADSMLVAGTALALYWEVYGTRQDPMGTARYRVRLIVEQQGVGIAVSVARLLGGVLGLGERDGQETEWEVARPAGDVLPELVVLERVPPARELKVTVEVTDLVSGARASAARVVTAAREP
jgi:hypothetical protein